MSSQIKPSDSESHRRTNDRTVLTTRPSIKPTAVLLGLAVVLGGAAIWYLGRDPQAIGDATPVVRRAIQILLVLAVVGLLGRIYLLSRTTYVVTGSAVTRRFEFLFKKKERRLPLGQVRATELDRGRIQALFGYGTLRFLTGGTNQSLGFVDFESVPDPDRVSREVQPLLQDTRNPERPGDE